ncbi:basic proline-rich protein-like [Chamaea fasciata]|uniref:basic proline-rich protein-like n=1 Tax=Chamaea fasciata TaxID=190680 RepID=UPI00336A6F12
MRSPRRSGGRGMRDPQLRAAPRPGRVSGGRGDAPRRAPRADNRAGTCAPRAHWAAAAPRRQHRPIGGRRAPPPRYVTAGPSRGSARGCTWPRRARRERRARPRPRPREDRPRREPGPLCPARGKTGPAGSPAPSAPPAGRPAPSAPPAGRPAPPGDRPPLPRPREDRPPLPRRETGPLCPAGRPAPLPRREPGPLCPARGKTGPSAPPGARPPLPRRRPLLHPQAAAPSHSPRRAPPGGRTPAQRPSAPHRAAGQWPRGPGGCAGSGH